MDKGLKIVYGILVLVIIFIGIMPFVLAVTYQLAEYFDVGDNRGELIGHTDEGDRYDSAQTFTPQHDMTLGIVGVKINSLNTEGILYGGIYNTTGGVPSGFAGNPVNRVATFHNVSQGTIGETPEWYNLTFSDHNASLGSGIVYAIVLAGTGANQANAYYWRGLIGADYTRGQYYYNSSTGWIAPSARDVLFRTWNFTGPPPDTCTCPGVGNNWEIDMSDYCDITEDCDLTTGTLSFTGAGNVTCNALINTVNMGDPGSSGIFWVDSGCYLEIN